MTNQTEYPIYDTANVQFKDLLTFAKTLGFEFNGKSFVRQHRNKVLSAVSVVSFNNMVRIYSSKQPEHSSRAKYASMGKYSFFITNQNETNYFDSSQQAVLNLIPFYAEDLVAAHTNKKFVSLKLQMNRKGHVNVTNHMLTLSEMPNEEQSEQFVKSISV